MAFRQGEVVASDGLSPVCGYSKYQLS